MRAPYIITIAALLASLSGCATVPKNLVQIEKNDDSILLQNKGVAKSLLLVQYGEWKGVRYVYGGSNKDGIDCSGFIRETFLSKFGIKLPRKSIIQGKVGTEIPVNILQAGDLVFFKTGINSYHAGIYIDNGEFLHASQSRGVVKSGLNEPYWRDRFWKARRVSISSEDLPGNKSIRK